MHQPLYEISTYYRACIRCQIWFNTNNPSHDCCLACREQLWETDRQQCHSQSTQYRDGIARRLIGEALHG